MGSAGVGGHSRVCNVSDIGVEAAVDTCDISILRLATALSGTAQGRTTDATGDCTTDSICGRTACVDNVCVMGGTGGRSAA